MKLTQTRRLGATDAAKLLGVSKYGGPLDVYRRLVLGVDVKVNAKMRRGTKYEPEVRRRYVAETGAELCVWVAPLIVEHPEHPWATCSPDDITRADVLCEYKTVSRWGAKGWADAPPIDYVLQVQWSLWVTGLETAHLYAAFGDDVGDEFNITHCQLYTLRADLELQAIFADVGGRFWSAHVETKTPPTTITTGEAHV